MFALFEHVRARLRWARSTRDTKLSKIHSKLSEVKEMKNELQAKLIEIALLERERDTAQMRVKQEHIKYRGELMLFEEPINNQLDPRLNGWSVVRFGAIRITLNQRWRRL